MDLAPRIFNSLPFYTRHKIYFGQIWQGGEEELRLSPSFFPFDSLARAQLASVFCHVGGSCAEMLTDDVGHDGDGVNGEQRKASLILKKRSRSPRRGRRV